MARKSSAPPLSFFAFQDIITSVVGIFVLITIIMVLELADKVEATSAASASQATTETVSAESLEKLRNELALVKLEYDQAKARRAERAKLTTDPETEKSRLEALVEQSKQQTARVEALLQENREQLESLRNDSKSIDQQWDETAIQREELAKLEARLRDLDKQMVDLESDDPLVFRSQSTQGRKMVLVILSKGRIDLSDSLAKQSESFSGRDRIKLFEGWLSKHDLSKLHFLILIRPSGTPEFSSVLQSLESEKAFFGFDVVSESRKLRLIYDKPSGK